MLLKSTTIREMAELFGIAALVATLVFVGLQLRQSDQIARAEIEATLGMMSIELAALISDHSDVWARGATEEELSDADTVVFENLVVAVNDARYSAFKQIVQTGDEEIAFRTLHGFAAYLHRHPGARRVWTKREAELQKNRKILDPAAIEQNSGYADTILSDLKKLDQLQP
jgi:hypothetical protein